MEFILAIIIGGISIIIGEYNCMYFFVYMYFVFFYLLIHIYILYIYISFLTREYKKKLFKIYILIL